MLNDLIVIEKRKSIIDQDGIDASIWEKELSCWACREKTVSTEEYHAHGYNMIVETTYKIRKSNKTKNLNTIDNRVIYKGNIYNIKSIIPEGKKGEFLKIQCKMVS